MTTGTFEKQRAIIYDLVAAGEVQGIVGGLGGIYLNAVSYTHLTLPTSDLV